MEAACGGQGSQAARRSVPAKFVAELRERMVYVGLPEDLAQVPQEAPLLASLLDPMRLMDSKRVYELVKDGLTAFADELEGREGFGSGAASGRCCATRYAQSSHRRPDAQPACECSSAWR